MNTKLHFTMLAYLILSFCPHKFVSAQECCIPGNCEKIIYVDSDASGLEDGSNWTNAFNDLNDALAIASVDEEIWVAEGTYNPGPAATDSFVLPAGVRVIGGFFATPGSEDDCREREEDPLINNTTLSGQLGTNKVIITNNSANSSTRLVGFTISGAEITAIENTAASRGIFEQLHIKGNGGGTVGIGQSVFSGGISNRTSSIITIRDSVFQSNTSSNIGGAVLNVGAVAIIDTCRFLENTAAQDGGAIFSLEQTNLTLRNCRFIENEAVGRGGGVYSQKTNANITDCEFENNQAEDGGGMFNGTDTGSNLRMRDCEFVNNTATDGISSGRGGGLYLEVATAGTPEIVDCLFTGNTALADGGAFHCESECFLTNCKFNGNEATTGDGSAINLLHVGAPGATTTLRVVNSLIFENHLSAGTGTLNSASGGAELELFNNTIADNTATSATASAGIDTTLGSGLFMRNNIVWGNAANGVSANLNSQIQFAIATDDVDFNLIQDNAIGGTVPFNPGGVGNNVDGDPVFVNAAMDDYALHSSSPALEAGSNSDIPVDEGDIDNDADDDEDTPLDLSLFTRVVNAGGVPGTINTCSAIVDMGALEFRFDCDDCVTAGDINGDGLLDGADIQSFVNCLLDNTGGDECGCQCGDYRDNNGVGIEDVPSFIRCLVFGPASCPELQTCASGSPASDCNNNSINDDQDIFLSNPSTTPELADCNNNDIPDGCDITDTTSADLNNNDIPDECEPDCNDNDVPDDKDIADSTSADCDSNGVPDECDEDCNGNSTPDACETMIDCNSNGIFDACESDCDNDGIPNECELSGNDCNGNGWPDDCDIDLPPPFNSLDCNNDSVPDECQLSGNDCNSNGILDECDIESELSDDDNDDDIPDECESQQQQSQGGGGGSSMSAPGGGGSSMMMTAPAPSAEVWDEFHEWCFETDFSRMTASEKFNAIVTKQLELELPPGRMFAE